MVRAAMSDASSVTFRRAEPADALALARLRYEFRASYDPATEPEADFLARCTTWIADRLSPGNSWRCWVAEESTQLIGTVWLQLIEKLPNPVEEPESHAYISSLYVVPSRRNAGVGSCLLEGCIRVCIDEGVDAMVLWPTPDSRRLYERYDFAVRDDLLERRLGPTLSHAGTARL
jgi:GNAT superfamily N-acetyltransferase